jgi:hypothetical protein
MAFVVEDGSGLSDSNSYAAVAEADSYFADRGNIEWAALEPSKKESSLIQGTDFADMKYHSLWIGDQATATQSLDWPRINAGYDGVIPRDLKYGIFEYALRASKGALAPDPIYGGSGGLQGAMVREKVGPLEREFEVTESSTSTQEIIRSYPQADLYFRSLISSSGGNRVYR